MDAGPPLSTLLSRVLVAFTIEFDNEFERRFAEAGHRGRFGVSLVMWSNFMRFVGDGITVGELATVAGLPKARMLSTLGGMERWRYVAVGPESAGNPPEARRDGWGSARGLRSDWVVRLTPVGRNAQEIWQPLFDKIERRWEERFGTDAIDELRGSLEAIIGQVDVELPEYLPVVGSSNGMVAGLSPPERRGTAVGEGDTASRLHLPALLSQVLLAYTIDFERESELSLPLSANFVRALDETGVPVRDLPLLAGVSIEATSMALTFLAKTGYVVVEVDHAGTKRVRLTPKGREAQERSRLLHHDVEGRWEARFGADDVRRLRASLHGVLDQRDGEHARLSRGLQPHAGGWRGSKRYIEHTEAMIADPSVGLPHYPMVLHRGGWPDGS
jgi:DNA-binding MarR family transcriptional regulator